MVKEALCKAYLTNRLWEFNLIYNLGAVQFWAKMVSLDFEVKWSEVKVTTRSNMVKSQSFKMYLSGEGLLVDSLL